MPSVILPSDCSNSAGCECLRRPHGPLRVPEENRLRRISRESHPSLEPTAKIIDCRVKREGTFDMLLKWFFNRASSGQQILGRVLRKLRGRWGQIWHVGVCEEDRGRGSGTGRGKGRGGRAKLKEKGSKRGKFSAQGWEGRQGGRQSEKGRQCSLPEDDDGGEGRSANAGRL